MSDNFRLMFVTCEPVLKLRNWILLCHRIDRRMRGHVFTTLLAYHLLWVIQKTLHSQGIHYSWKTIINFMKSHVRVTTTMTT
ncbi:MAG: hypothetical protein ACP5TY_07075, partial [Thermodesulforhabdaceae bacterium]